MDRWDGGVRVWHVVVVTVAIVLVGAVLMSARSAQAQDCTTLLGLLQQGYSNAEVAQATGLSTADVEFCRQQLSRPIFVGPAGVPPVGAAGPPPRGAAGPPTTGGAAGPPPVNAPGPPPVGHDLKRLP